MIYKISEFECHPTDISPLDGGAGIIGRGSLPGMPCELILKECQVLDGDIKKVNTY